MKPRQAMPLMAALILFALLSPGCGRKLPTALNAGSGFQRAILLEVFTSENCTNCPKADAAAEQIAAEMGDSVCLVELHPQAAFGLGDSIGLAGNDTLVRAYEGTASGSLPLFVCDGVDRIIGTASDVPGTRSNYRQAIDARKMKPSPLRITISALADVHDVRYSVRIESDAGLHTSASLSLVLAVVEDSVNAYGKSFRSVARKLYPGATGAPLALVPSSSATQSGSVPMDGGWLPWRLTLVAYVRDNTSREIIQAAKARVVAAQTPPAAPALAAPSDGATDLSLGPTVRWNTSSGAASYALQVSTDSAFGQLVHYPSGLAGTSQTLSGLANATTYYWRVSAGNNAGISAWSDAWSFTTTAVLLPAAPLLIYPSDADTGVSKSPLLRWTASSHASSYALQLATSPSFNPGSIVYTRNALTDTSFAAAGLIPATRYYWRVNAGDLAGASPWSATWSFVTTQSPAPEAPSLVAPSDGATAVATSPNLEFSWDSSYGASTYGLQVSPCSDFRSFACDQGGLAGTSSIVNGLDSLTTYYWRVNASNGNGSSSWSDIWSCTDARGYSFSRLITPDSVLRVPDTIINYSLSNPPPEVGFHFYLTSLAAAITLNAQAPIRMQSDTSSFWGQLCSPGQCAGPNGTVWKSFASSGVTQDWTAHFLFTPDPPAPGLYRLTLNVWAGDAPGHVMSRNLYVSVTP